MLPPFDHMYTPILMSLAIHSPEEVPATIIQADVINWFSISENELAQTTTGERKRKPHAPAPPVVNLFKKRFSLAESDLVVDRYIIKFKHAKTYALTQSGLQLLNYILTEFKESVFNRTALVNYSPTFAAHASHHRGVCGLDTHIDTEHYSATNATLNRVFGIGTA